LGLSKLGYKHDVVVQRRSTQSPDELLPHGMIFYRLIENAVVTEPHPYRELVA
jgi:hypothetical protein